MAENPAPPTKRLMDLRALLASLPRLSEEEATAFGEDLDGARAELEAGRSHGTAADSPTSRRP